MTAAAAEPSSIPTSVDFTDTVGDFYHLDSNLDGYEQATVDGKFALWAGDASNDGQIILSGQGNDVNPIFNAVTGASGNNLGLPSYIYVGYHAEDIDLGGSAIFTGQYNDVNTIFNAIATHPRNH
ncbi:MAG: hypothetical protein R2873_14985 [Caldilineaceae bacterium]